MKRIVSREAGLGLISAVVAAGIVATLGMYIAKISTNASNVGKSIKNTAELTAFTGYVSNVLLKEDACTDFLGGSIPVLNTSVVDNLSGRSLVVNGRTVLAENLTIAGTNYTVDKLQLIKNDAVYGDHLRVVLERPETSRAYGPRSVVRRFGIFIKYNSLQVDKCFSDVDNAIVSSVSAVCTDVLGGTIIDPTTGACSVERQEVYMQEVEIAGGDMVTVFSPNPGKKVTRCSRCGGNCSPPACPAGYIPNSNVSCGMDGNCGWHRWRNCHRRCIQQNPNGYVIMSENLINPVVTTTVSPKYTWKCTADPSTATGGRWGLTGSSCSQDAANIVYCDTPNESAINFEMCCNSEGPNGNCGTSGSAPPIAYTGSGSSGGSSGSSSSGSSGGSSGSSGGGCFLEGTMITMANGLKKRIEDIIPGESVVSLINSQTIEGSSPVSISKVNHVMSFINTGYKYGINEKVYNGKKEFVTGGHPFMMLDGRWKAFEPEMTPIRDRVELNVTKLKLGDIIVKEFGIEPVITISRVQTSEKVYNIEVNGTHEYIANGYRVHNKLDPLDVFDME